ncbi:MAG: hypothetical protein HW421_3839, partial [Ignavibacteria bacterium]|nr:hypothetical protein [Ignavibacteria bacterium]
MYATTHSPKGKFTKLLVAPLLIILWCALLTNANAQVQVGATNYTTLKACFDAINGGAHTGSITVNITGNTTETAQCVINASGQGSANYSSITISPSGGARTITGNFMPTAATGAAVIILNGADNITIDGRISGSGNNLTIVNNCEPFGSPAYSTANIWLQSYNTVSPYGCTYVTIRNCNLVGPTNKIATTTIFSYGIYAAGTSISNTGTGYNNDNLTIQENVFTRMNWAIFVRSSTTGTNMNDGLNITQNTIGSNDPLQYVSYRGIDIYYAASPSITQNKIFNIKNSMYAIYTEGIEIGTYCSNATIDRNQIYGIWGQNSYSYGAYGIYVISGSQTNINITNNLVYDILTGAYTNSITYGPKGIYIAGGSGHKLYYNTVHLYGSILPYGTSAVQSAALLVYSAASTMDIRNNVLKNTISSSVAGSYNVALNMYSTSMYSTLNNNDYYATGSYGYLGCWSGGTYISTLSSLQSYSGQDGSSRNVDPGFNSNVMLRPNSGSGVVGVGTPITSYTTDFLGNSRSSSAPSMGAYEGGADNYGPTFSFTSVSNQNNTNNLTISTVSISDATGVNSTSGTAPRIYYRRAGNANTYSDNTSGTDGWKWADGSYSSPYWSFTIDYSKLYGGISAGTTIQYFIVAQDVQSTPLVSTNSMDANNGLIFNITPSSVNLSSSAFPVIGNLNFYMVYGNISGTLNIGTSGGGGLNSLNNFGGLFHMLKQCTLTGNLTVNINTDLPNEIMQQDMRPWAESPSASGYSITIKPGSASVKTITGYSTWYSNFNGAMIRLVGVDKVTFDGSFGGSGNYFTFINNAVGTLVRFDSNYVSGTYDPCNFNTFKNCNFWCNEASISINRAVEFVGYGIHTSNTITNCVIKRAYYPIWCYSGTSSYMYRNNEFSNNMIGDTNIWLTGYGYDMYVYYNRGAKILNNTFLNMASAPILLYYSDSSRVEGNRSYVTDNAYLNSVMRPTYGFLLAYGTYDTIVGNDFSGFKTGGLYLQYPRDFVCTDNKIHDPSTIAAAATMYGMYLYMYYNTTAITSYFSILRNQFYNMSNNYNGSCSIMPMYLYQYSGYPYDVTVANNSITGVKTYGYSTTTPLTTTQSLGIYMVCYSNVKLYYNTVNVSGGFFSATANPLSTCVYIAANCVGLDMRNNAFINTNSGYAYGIASSVLLTNKTFDRNDYYVPNYMLGYYNSTNITNLSAWRSGIGQDANSISSDPLFNSQTNLRPLGTSPLLGAGTYISAVTTDMLNVTRSTSAPSLGAYEQGGDFTAPVIQYTLLANTGMLTNRNFSSEITDYTGVNNSAFPPRLYYKKLTNANNFVGNTSSDDGWKYVPGSQVSNTWTFAINYSLLTGGSVSVGDVIQYFVVAQDIAPAQNVAINSGAFTTLPTNINLSSSAFPITGTINQYVISQAFAGSYNVGSGQTYTSLTKANGFFAAVNSGVVTGDITVNITSDLSEDGVAALNQWTEESGSGFKMYILPATPSMKTISGSVANFGMIRLNGTDRVIFDGRNVNTGNMSLLTFNNTYTSTSAVFQFISLGSGLGATNDTIRYCTIRGGSEIATNISGIYLSGADHDYTSVTNNTILKAYVGLYANGTGGVYDYCDFSSNTIGAANGITSDYIYFEGMDLTNMNNSKFNNNVIRNIYYPGGNCWGVYIRAGI